MDEYILIANPISGKGKGKTVAEQAHKALTFAGHKGELRLTTGMGDAKRFTQEAISNGIKWIYACGGDGTLHEVVNTIAGNTDVTLGVLPCGRGNDLATAMNISRKPHHAIQTLLNGTVKSMDLGHVRSEKGSEHYFTTIATCGYDTEVSRLAASRETPFAGTASYIYAAIKITNVHLFVLRETLGYMKVLFYSLLQEIQVVTVEDLKLYRMLVLMMVCSMFVSFVQFHPSLSLVLW